MKQYYIYKIICLCDEWNGKFYIGKHYGNINDAYTGSGRRIKNYFNEYGKERNVTYEKIILEIGDENNICDLEREYIRKYMESELCLNLHCVSAKGNLGRQLSDEHKRKISETLKDRPISEETKKKMSESRKGRIVSAETRRKISEGQKGRVPWNKGKRNNRNTHG